ncbi:hypothetical protein BDZ94DRAFT_1315012 [Collybia nuda]|uniref:F-box domain-containing protein n=1 Tax=Collybia nuda TaxID=64659 RepID=A0A9P5XRX7_9AGAR|nr:hypothetical protein BDZ94DRAFT_1315012 [Collybia nuda]
MRIANSPLKRVPPEILGRIFMWYVGGRVIFPLKQTLNPWKLGHVSSQWRQVLWSTADLWNDLEISLPTGCDKNTDIVGSLSIVRSALNDVLYRGKGLHNLRIFSHSITPVADIIFPFVHRFRSLSIKNVSYGIFISLLELPTGAFPFLENINLNIYYDPASADRASHSSSLQAAPNLTSVTFSFRPTKALALEWDKFLDPFEFPSLQNLAINPGPSLNLLYPLICLKAITSLVLRSGCHLEAFSIGGAMDYRENHHLPSVIIPDVSEIIKASPTLKILEGTLILPASIFIAMKSGQLHLPKLHLVIVRLDPDGLKAFIDFLNSLIHFEGNQQLPTYSGTIRQAIISCQATDGYQTAMDAFTNKSWLYQAVGIYVSVERFTIDHDGE